MKKRYKVVNKFRFYVFIITLSMLGTTLIMSLLSINQVYGSIYKYDYDEVKIIEGDTLWFLAMDYTSKEYDIRRMLYEIKRMNKMETSQIYPGDILKIPLINED